MALALPKESRLTDRWYSLAPHETQILLCRSPARFKVVPAGRRSGKTERAKRQLIKAALKATGPTPAFFAAAPTRDQAKKIYWDDLKALSKGFWSKAPSESLLIIFLVNGATIHVIGMDRPERIEGTPWDGGILDEYANMKEKAWEANVYPALGDRGGWCWLIGVPEGRNHYYDIWKKAVGGADPEWAGFTWTSAEVMQLYGKGHIVEQARMDLDELTFQQEFEGSFINFSGQAYYPFDERLHCGRIADRYNPRADLIFCFDFNVEPGVAAVIQEIDFPPRVIPIKGINIDGRQLFAKDVLEPPNQGTGIIGEVHIPTNSNTPAVCRKLIKDWGNHQGRIRIYGDATGGARGTAKTEGSDWDLVKNNLYGHFGAERVSVRVPDSNPSERARINAVNSRLRSQNQVVRIMVDGARAPNVVKDFEGVRLLEGGSGEIDKKIDPKLTHLTDAIGYYVEHEFPVRGESFGISELRA